MRAGQASPSSGQPPDQDDRALLERLRKPSEPWWVRSRAGVVAAGVALVLLVGGIAVVLYVGNAGQRSADAQWQATLAKNATANASAFATVTAEAQATRSTEAAVPAGQATAGAAGSATASSQPAAAPVVSTATRVAAPTNAPKATLAPTAAAGGPLYVADFTKWPVGESPAPESVRGGYDSATTSYVLALTDPTRGYVYWLTAPDGPKVADFQLDVDTRKLAGPSMGAYGVIFRVQTPGPNDKTAPSYTFLIHPDAGTYALTWTNADDTGTSVATSTITPAIHKGALTNHLTVIARGNLVTLAINDQVVGTYHVEHATAGKAGLIVLNSPSAAGPQPMAAAFSNFRLAAPPSGDAYLPAATGATQ